MHSPLQGFYIIINHAFPVQFFDAHKSCVCCAQYVSWFQLLHVQMRRVLTTLCVAPNEPPLSPSICRRHIISALRTGCSFAPDRVIAYSSRSLTRRPPFMPESNTFAGSSWLFEETFAFSCPAIIFVHAHKG